MFLQMAISNMGNIWIKKCIIASCQNRIGGSRHSLGSSSAASAATSGSTSGATSASGASAATSASASFTFSGSSGLSLLEGLEVLGVLEEGRLDEVGLGPQIGGKEGVGLLEGLEESSNEVLSGSGVSGGAGVNIIDTGELEDLLGDLGGNLTGSSGGGDHPDDARAALALDLHGDGMDGTDSGAPVSSSDGDQVDLGVQEGALDGDLDFLGDLDADTDMAHLVTGGDDGLESGSLTGLGLLLHRDDAHDLIGELGLGVGDESVNDGGLLDGDGVGVDLLKGLDLAGLDESSELGKGSPLVLSAESSSSTSGATTAATSSTTSSSEASSSSLSFHFDCVF
mmetsp:Transcript_21942/g.34083  ORF Transcript_21942/g.34083 Transcript_21942/m.34083 type:complete len:340 (-) Transcript_21942:40-1059(-)